MKSETRESAYSSAAEAQREGPRLLGLRGHREQGKNMAQAS